MPDDGERVASIVVAIAVNVGLASLVGASVGRLLMAGPRSSWAEAGIAATRRWLRWSVVVILVGHVAWLILVSLSSAEDSGTSSSNALLTVLLRTRLGSVWLAGTASLAVAAIVAGISARASSNVTSLALLACAAAFAVCRAATSHAGAIGGATPLVVHALHLLSTSLWAGLVWRSASRRLPDEAASPLDRDAAHRWVARLSTTAGSALAVVLVTGAANAWLRVDALDALVSSAYGRVLAVKLGLVAIAALLGTWNRFVVLPELLGDGDRAMRPHACPRRRFLGILRAESLVLVGAVVAASVLAASGPP